MRVKLRRKTLERRGRKETSYEVTIPKAIAETLFANVEYFNLRIETKAGKPVLVLEPTE